MIQLINDQFIKDKIPTKRDVDERTINVTVKLVQETDLPDLVGDPLTKKLYELAQSGTMTSGELKFFEAVQLWLGVKVSLEFISVDTKGYLSMISKEKVLNSRVKTIINNDATLRAIADGSGIKKFSNSNQNQMNTFYFI